MGDRYSKINNNRNSNRVLSGYNIRVEGKIKQAVDLAKSRLIFVALILCLSFVTIIFRLFEVALINNQKISHNQNIEQVTPFKFRRGDIVDRNGVLLASNLSATSIYANPKDLADPKKAAKLISKTISGLSYKTLLKRFKSDKSFVWVKRNITPKEEYKINNLGIPGVYFLEDERRVYPHGRLFSHMIGYVGIDGDGLAGIEKSFNKQLKSEESNNKPLQLAFDVRVQEIVREELGGALKDFVAKGASGIVMDVKTGEIISAVSLPDFDPNKFTKSKPKERFNITSLGTYELGSIFKAFTVAAAIDSGKVTVRKQYDATKPIKVSGHYIRDFHPEERTLSVSEILMYSSNIGSAKIAMDLGVKAQKKYLEKLGILSGLDIEIPEKGAPIYPHNWRLINAVTISYGHGIAVTPVHLIGALSSVVNGGYYNKPSLIKKSEIEVLETGVKIFKTSTSKTMRKLLRMVVADGTGSKADVVGYMVGGKTGTAEKLINGKYSRKDRIATFAGVFPMVDPRYAVLVLFDEPKGNKSTFGLATGGMIAAPVSARIIERIGPILGVDTVSSQSPEIIEVLNTKKTKEDKVAAN